MVHKNGKKTNHPKRGELICFCQILPRKKMTLTNIHIKNSSTQKNYIYLEEVFEEPTSKTHKLLIVPKTPFLSTGTTVKK